MNSLRAEVNKFVMDSYGNSPEFLWEGDFDTAVFRHNTTKKWYGIIMKVKKSRLGLEGEGEVEILNVKADPLLIDLMVREDGIYRAYHMNKRTWVSISLMGEVGLDKICGLLDESYKMTAPKNKKNG